VRIRGAILLGALLALGLAAEAQANKTKINKADQAAAGSSLLKLSELPAPFTWKGGKTTSAGSGASSFNCKGFKPKSSDLVTTGKADATFTAQGVQLQDQAEVLQTAKMVSDDFGRTFVPALVPCLETTFEHSITGLVVLKVGRVTFPQVAKYAAAYRIIFKITPKGKASEEGIVDFVALGAGRKELTLLFTAILGSAAQVKSGANGMSLIDVNLATLLARNALGAKLVA
jgi:hypothetical protein